MTESSRARPFRILWICSHRTHRYEEVSLFLRAGAEIVPIKAPNHEFPNAIDPDEETDPLYPNWRRFNSIPEPELTRIRAIDYYKQYADLSAVDKDLLNKWIDMVIVASYTKILVSFLDWFTGFLMLRAFGGYPYSGVLQPETRFGRRTLNKIAETDRYFWSPNIPYLSAIEDGRITRSEIIIPVTVSRDRYSSEWAARDSDHHICEVISLIERYRAPVYADYVQAYGQLPLKIFGLNPKSGSLANDSRVVGTLSDEQYYPQITRCRAMLYEGLNSPYHIHYHALETLMMKVPLIFFSGGSIAHIARYYGESDEHLREAGMCSSRDEAIRLADACINDLEFALQLSERQEFLRKCFAPEKAEHAVADFVQNVKLKRNYFREHRHNRPKRSSLISRVRSFCRCAMNRFPINRN
jgi:hypothetical protein